FGTISSGTRTTRRTKDAAASETATAASIRPLTCRSAGPASSISLERSGDAWKVATTGAWAARTASIEVLGVSGSCAWMSSGSNERIAERIRRHDPGENEIGATVPRAGARTGRPTIRTPAYSDGRAPGARIDRESKR